MPRTDRAAKARIDRRMKENLYRLGRVWDAELRQSLGDDTVKVPAADAPAGGTGSTVPTT